MDNLLRDFLMLLATIDPVGTLSLFVGVTAGVEDSARRRIAIRAIIYSAVILIAFIVVGQLLLEGLGISLVAFQLSGGIILFLFGTQMIFGTGSTGGSNEGDEDHDVAIFPLAIPSIASPGSILAVVLLTDNNHFTITEQAVTTALLMGVLFLTLMLLLQANRIYRWIGKGGANILTRVMGLILASLAVEMTLEGVMEVTKLIRSGQPLSV